MNIKIKKTKHQFISIFYTLDFKEFNIKIYFLTILPATLSHVPAPRWSLLNVGPPEPPRPAPAVGTVDGLVGVPLIHRHGVPQPGR